MSMIKWNCFRFMTWALIFCKHAHHFLAPPLLPLPEAQCVPWNGRPIREAMQNGYAPSGGHTRFRAVWLRGRQASHSALCSSHQAGKAGSFGERVGVILCLNPEFPLKVKGAIVLEPTPKWKNCNNVFLFIVQIFP